MIIRRLGPLQLRDYVENEACLAGGDEVGGWG